MPGWHAPAELAILLAVAGTTPAIGSPPTPEPEAGARFLADANGTLAARGRLQLGTALSLRDDTVVTPLRRLRARGPALSQLVLDGLWLPYGTAIGLGGRLAVQRFSLQGEDPVSGRFDSVATSIEASAGLVGRRLAFAGRLSLEGQIGYGIDRVPVAKVQASGTPGAMPVAATAFWAHGPALGARLAVAAGPSVGLETSLRVRPIAFGARFDDRALSRRALAAGAAITLGRFSGGGLRFSGLLGYELAIVQAEDDGGGLTVRQVQHSLGLALRTAFLLPPLPASGRLTGTTFARPVNAAAREVRGLVRAAASPAGTAAGVPLAGVTVAVVGGPVTATAANGTFLISGLPPGLATLRLSGDGLVEEEEVLSIPPGGVVSVEIFLRSVEAARLAIISGLVRSEQGVPVEARVSLVELGIVTRADAQGRFRLEVPAGRHTLVVEGPGLHAQRKSLTLNPGDHSIYNLDLQTVR